MEVDGSDDFRDFNWGIFKFHEFHVNFQGCSRRYFPLYWLLNRDPYNGCWFLIIPKKLGSIHSLKLT